MKSLAELAPHIRLFQPDIYSSTEPSFVVVPPNTVAKAERALKNHYGHLGSVIGPSFRPRGAQINSSNTLVHLASGPVIVKQIPNRNTTAIEFRLEVADRLRRVGVPLPEIHSSTDGSRVVFDEDCAWVVLGFVKGTYFRGGRTELASVSIAVSQLRTGLAQIGCSIADNSVPVPDYADWELLENLSRRRGDWNLIFREHVMLFSSSWDLLCECLSRVLSVRDHLKGFGLCHIDLHPHNVIMKDGVVVGIIDLDSIRLASIPVFEAFTAYKLLRQSLSLSRPPENLGESRQVVDMFLQEAAALKAFGLAPSVLAQAEILRRLLYILREAVYANDRTWMHVLPVHVAGIVESEALFRVSSA